MNGSLGRPKAQFKSKWSPLETMEALGAGYGPRLGAGGAPWSEQDFHAGLMWLQKLICRPRGLFKDYFPVFERDIPKKW